MSRRETGSRKRKLKRGEAEEEIQTPSIVAREERTRAFLVIASSAPLFEARRQESSYLLEPAHNGHFYLLSVHLASAKDSLVFGPKTETRGVLQSTKVPSSSISEHLYSTHRGNIKCYSESEEPKIAKYKLRRIHNLFSFHFSFYCFQSFTSQNSTCPHKENTIQAFIQK